MKKNIKYSVSLFVIVLSVMFGYLVYAEDNKDATSEKPVACTMDAKLCPDGITSVSRVGPDCEFAKCPGEKEVNSIKDSIKTNREEMGVQLEKMIQSVKDKREEFKTEFEAIKEQAKLKIAEMKTNFKESLKNIKDENKKISAEKIVDTIQGLNAKTTDNFSNKIDQIENVLVSIESRISKAESRGLDVSSVKTQVEKAKIVIAEARNSVLAQSQKVYITNITDEATLKIEMKKIRDAYSKDIKAVREKVKLAHFAVRDTATTLAKIPKIDDDNKVTNKVEDNNTNNN